MSNSLVRLKNQPDVNGEDQVIIKVQHKQKQYPLPVLAVKVNPKYFDQYNYGKWLSKSYINKAGVNRAKTTINKRIQKFKTRIDTTLEILDELNFETLSVAIIRNALDKPAKEIKANRQFLVDSFYQEELMSVFEQEFMDAPFIADDKKNIQALHLHLSNYFASLDSNKPVLMQDLNSKLFADFTQHLLGYQFKKGNVNDPYTYLGHDTVYKQIKKLRRFKSYCKNVLCKDLPQIEYKFPYRGTLDVQNPLSLYPFELDTIYHNDNLSSPQMIAKKLFFLAFSIGGQRISDIEHIVRNKLYKSDFRQYWQQKTKKQMYSGLLDAYFKKYQQDDIPLYSGKHINSLLKSIIREFASMMETNEAFKEYCQDNGFEDAFIRTVSKKSYRGRSSTANWSKAGPLADSFTFGNARHTFISTLIFRYNKTKEEVKLYTGHSSERVMDYYLDKKIQMEAYSADKEIIKPDERYDFEQMLKLNDFHYLEGIRYFDLDTEEDLKLEALNAKEAKALSLKNKD